MKVEEGLFRRGWRLGTSARLHRGRTAGIMLKTPPERVAGVSAVREWMKDYLYE